MLTGSNYLIWVVRTTLTISLGFIASLVISQVVMAETDPTAAPTEFGNFIETSTGLTFTVGPKDLLANQRLYINDEEKVVWGYVGPEIDPGLRSDCNSTQGVWFPGSATSESDAVSPLASRAIKAEARVVEVEGGGLAALLTLELPTDATNDWQYCFWAPILEGEEVRHIYKFYQLRLAGSTNSVRVNFEVIESTPSTGTNDLIPSSLVLRPLTTGDVLTNWQYARFGGDEICGLSNTETQFTNLEINNDQLAELPLTREMAGQLLCFKVTDSDGQQIYESYKIAQLTDRTDDNGEAESDEDYVWAVIVLTVLVLGVVAYFIVRSK